MKSISYLIAFLILSLVSCRQASPLSENLSLPEESDTYTYQPNPLAIPLTNEHLHEWLSSNALLEDLPRQDLSHEGDKWSLIGRGLDSSSLKHSATLYPSIITAMSSSADEDIAVGFRQYQTSESSLSISLRQLEGVRFDLVERTFVEAKKQFGESGLLGSVDRPSPAFMDYLYSHSLAETIQTYGRHFLLSYALGHQYTVHSVRVAPELLSKRGSHPHIGEVLTLLERRMNSKKYSDGSLLYYRIVTTLPMKGERGNLFGSYSWFLDATRTAPLRPITAIGSSTVDLWNILPEHSLRDALEPAHKNSPSLPPTLEAPYITIGRAQVGFEAGIPCYDVVASLHTRYGNEVYLNEIVEIDPRSSIVFTELDGRVSKASYLKHIGEYETDRGYTHRAEELKKLVQSCFSCPVRVNAFAEAPMASLDIGKSYYYQFPLYDYKNRPLTSHRSKKGDKLYLYNTASKEALVLYLFPRKGDTGKHKLVKEYGMSPTWLKGMSNPQDYKLGRTIAL